MTLVPVLAPALVIVAVAAVIVRRARHDHVVDLTAPKVPLSELVVPEFRGPSIGRPTGELVPPGGSTLGARMLRVAEQQRSEPAESRRRADGRVRRRGTPLVASRT